MFFFWPAGLAAIGLGLVLDAAASAYDRDLKADYKRAKREWKHARKTGDWSTYGKGTTI